MSTSKRETGVARSDGNRGGVPELHVQLSSEGGTYPDWERAFAILSASLGKQMISGDALYLIFMSLQSNAGEQVAERFAEHIGLNRSKEVHNFMG
jgi:hypothetical protein